MKNPTPPTPSRPRTRLAATLGLFLGAAIGASAQTVTLTYTLHPGWNALLMDVVPTNTSPAVVFSNLPILEVWGRVEPVSAVTFIQNQAEALVTLPGWWSWFPGTNAPGFASTLKALVLNRPYLIKVDGSNHVALQVTGTPNYHPPAWKANQLNLRTFPVDPDAPPTFQQFFQYSTAHYDNVAGQVLEMYRLNATGTWVRVQNNDVMHLGEAYWVYSQGASDYVAPLEITTGLPASLDFAQAASRLSLGVRWRGVAPAQVMVSDLNPTTTALAWQQLDPTNGVTWIPLPPGASQNLQPNTPASLGFGLRRSVINTTNYGTVLSLRDGLGTRHLAAVTATKIIVPASGPNAAAVPFAGLWVGDARVQAVSEPHSGVLLSNSASGSSYRLNTGTNPTPVKSEFPLRLLLHVDTNGVARLLKQVIQMWQNGTTTNDAQGNFVSLTNGYHVYLTDDSLVGNYHGSAFRDGQMVGRRLSAIGYDFDSDRLNMLAMTGLFAPNQTLSASLVLSADNPRNPYKHKYHPDHDNLDASFNPLPAGQQESYDLERDMSLTFSATDTTSQANPDYGYSVLGGTYNEVIRGLHQMPLYVSGVFELHRISVAPVLNQ